ncbi:urotensin-2 [Discoglossus pictus]
MHRLVFSCLIFVSFSCPLLSRPVIDSNEEPYPFPDAKMNFAELSNLDQTYLLQNLPAFLRKHNERGDTDIFIKEALNPENYNLEESVKEVLLGKHPRPSLLSGLQSKDKKQYKKRGGNLSECFWKYCV